MKLKIYSLALIVMAGLLWGCYPDGAEYVEDLDLVFTDYDKSFDFKSLKTYSLPDKIVKITGRPNDPPEYVKDVYAVPMLQQIDNNMAALGWTKVPLSSSPDIQLLPGTWSSTTIVYGWWGYYCWYYPYYCGGGGWYYPYYPSYSYSYTTGTLLTTIVDPNHLSTDGSLRVVWTSAVNGLLSGSFNTNRIFNAIDQSFRQSPYLKRN